MGQNTDSRFPNWLPQASPVSCSSNKIDTGRCRQETHRQDRWPRILEDTMLAQTCSRIPRELEEKRCSRCWEHLARYLLVTYIFQTLVRLDIGPPDLKDLGRAHTARRKSQLELTLAGIPSWNFARILYPRPLSNLRTHSVPDQVFR